MGDSPGRRLQVAGVLDDLPLHAGGQPPGPQIEGMIMSKKLEGKVAIVTGGSAGIGLGAAKRFAEEGAKVFITGRKQEGLDRAVAEIGHGAVGVKADASVLADIDRIYETVKVQAGRIDVLFLNAGFYEFQKF